MAVVRLVRLLHTCLPATSARPTGPPAHASLDDSYEVATPLRALRDAGAAGQATTLLDRGPAAHASPDTVAWLLDALREAGATGQVTALASRAAAHASFDDPSGFGVARLLAALQEVGSADRRIDRAPSSGREVLAVLPARRARGAVPVRPGDRRPPGQAMGLGRPRLSHVGARRRATASRRRARHSHCRAASRLQRAGRPQVGRRCSLWTRWGGGAPLRVLLGPASGLGGEFGA